MRFAPQVGLHFPSFDGGTVGGGRCFPIERSSRSRLRFRPDPEAYGDSVGAVGSRSLWVFAPALGKCVQPARPVDGRRSDRSLATALELENEPTEALPLLGIFSARSLFRSIADIQSFSAPSFSANRPCNFGFIFSTDRLRPAGVDSIFDQGAGYPIRLRDFAAIWDDLNRRRVFF